MGMKADSFFSGAALPRRLFHDEEVLGAAATRIRARRVRASCGRIGYVMDTFGVLFDAAMEAQDFCSGAMAC